ncbi:MAG: hypothetical protein E7Y34_01470 [Mycoplasma sp.]|nr:hypothetical protein [Mycoplasma sp.]
MSWYSFGYQKPNKQKKVVFRYMSALVLDPNQKSSLYEKLIKFFIYISLRIVIPKIRWRNPKRNLFLINNSFKTVNSNDSYFVPGAMTYYLLIAFIPSMILASSLFSINFIDNFLASIVGKKDVFNLYLGYMIPGFDKLMEGAYLTNLFKIDIDRTGSIFSKLTIILSSLYLMSTGFSSISYAQNHLYKNKKLTNWFIRQLKGLIIALIFVFMFGVFMFINILFDSIWPKDIINIVWYIKTLLIVTLVFFQLFIIITTIFYVSVDKKTNFKNLLPGISVTVVPSFFVFLLFSFPFSQLANTYFKDYAIFGSIFYLGLLVYYLSLFMYLGITINGLYYQSINVGQFYN